MSSSSIASYRQRCHLQPPISTTPAVTSQCQLRIMANAVENSKCATPRDSHLTSVPVAAAHLRQPLRALHGQPGGRADHRPGRRGDLAQFRVVASRTMLPMLFLAQLLPEPSSCGAAKPALDGLRRCPRCLCASLAVHSFTRQNCATGACSGIVATGQNNEEGYAQYAHVHACSQCSPCKCAGTQQTPAQLRRQTWAARLRPSSRTRRQGHTLRQPASWAAPPPTTSLARALAACLAPTCCRAPRMVIILLL